MTDAEVKECYSELVHKESGKKLELDIYLPKEMLAFEYQGEQHYKDIYALGSRLAWPQIVTLAGGGKSRGTRSKGQLASSTGSP